jgi:hypothetical protein
VRLTNRLSYKVADEFVWMGMRHMTNKFRVDLQVNRHFDPLFSFSFLLNYYYYYHVAYFLK